MTEWHRLAMAYVLGIVTVPVLSLVVMAIGGVLDVVDRVNLED